MASPAVALPAFRSAPAPLPAVPFFRSSPPQPYRAATLPRRHPGQLPLPPRPASLPSSLPATTRAHRQRRGAAAICLPHPSRNRLTHPPPSSERRRRCSSPRALLRASDPERRLLLRSSSAPPIQGKQQIQVGASPFTFRGAKVDHAADIEPRLLLCRSSVPPIQDAPPPSPSSTSEDLLPPRSLPERRPAGRPSLERMTCSGECSWNQAISTRTYAIIKH
jgi:hypothetical protein